MSEWRIEGGMLKVGKRTIADMRYVAALPERQAVIKCAPELLSALEHTVMRDHPYTEWCDACNVTRLIHRAKGLSQ